MTPQQIESQATEKTVAIASEIKAFCMGHKKGPISLKAVGERAGMANLGKLLTRPGITMLTVFRVLVALEHLCLENRKSIRPLMQKIVEVLTT